MKIFLFVSIIISLYSEPPNLYTKDIILNKADFYQHDKTTKNNIHNTAINKNIRKLENDGKNGNEENDNDKKENNDNNINNKESNNNLKQNELNKKNSGMGWLGVCLIIILSILVIYALYVAFRYYRRKKYQNPSFYYKITEEMFDDITPIE